MSQPYAQPEYQQPYAVFDPAPPEPPAEDHRRRRVAAFIAAAVLLLAAIGTLIVLFTGDSERPLTVKLQLLDFDGGSDCDGGSGGYDDIGPGMPITVKDQDGKLIGSGSLPDSGESQDVDGVTYGCIWSVAVMVPDDAQQYAVEGGSRGAVTYSQETLADHDWTAELSIGD